MNRPAAIEKALRRLENKKELYAQQILQGCKTLKEYQYLLGRYKEACDTLSDVNYYVKHGKE